MKSYEGVLSALVPPIISFEPRADHRGGYAVVLTLAPTGFSECAPLFCRSCAKFVRNACKADVELGAVVEALAAAVPAVEALAVEALAAVPAVVPAVEIVPAALVVPLKSLINLSNAELRFDNRRWDTPLEEPVLLDAWPLLKSCTSAFSSETMSRGP
jgi:hypothetical protein